LILGGGSGWLLNDICCNYPHLEIDYIDLSPRMIDKAKKRVKETGYVNFILGTEDDLPYHHYDGVITNFFLDMFDENGLSIVIEKIKRSLGKEVIWLVTDFVNERKSHAIKLWCMYLFFKIITQIDATHLSDWRGQMLKAGFKLSEKGKFNNGFIAAHVYQRASLAPPDRLQKKLT
jgi:ubiquinone/menaquinone biosynthesis C-methylase UbiE